MLELKPPESPVFRSLCLLVRIAAFDTAVDRYTRRGEGRFIPKQGDGSLHGGRYQAFRAETR